MDFHRPRDGFAGGEAYNFHLGSTGCEDGPTGGVTTCMNPSRVEVQLDDGTDGSVVLLDLSALFDGAPSRLDIDQRSSARISSARSISALVV